LRAHENKLADADQRFGSTQGLMPAEKASQSLDEECSKPASSETPVRKTFGLALSPLGRGVMCKRRRSKCRIAFGKTPSKKIADMRHDRRLESWLPAVHQQNTLRNSTPGMQSDRSAFAKLSQPS
jgi:hypothetical protein